MRDFLAACRRQSIRPTRFVLAVEVRTQTVCLLERCSAWCKGKKPGTAAFQPPKSSAAGKPPLLTRFAYDLRRRYRVSTSRFGVGQRAESNKTPLGLHRIAEKIGGGQPIGTAFRSRQVEGLIWNGLPNEPIVHRILWLAGLEPGFNQGGEIDSRARYIYIHGTHDELALGRPASRGCIQLAASDLMPLFDRLPLGTLVWIG